MLNCSSPNNTAVGTRVGHCVRPARTRGSSCGEVALGGTEGERNPGDGYSSPMLRESAAVEFGQVVAETREYVRGDQVRLGLSDLAERHPGHQRILLEPSG